MQGELGVNFREEFEKETRELEKIRGRHRLPRNYSSFRRCGIFVLGACETFDNIFSVNRISSRSVYSSFREIARRLEI